MKNKSVVYFIILLLTVFSTIAQARPDDRDKPIHITADTAELNDKTGISIYRGDVEMIQGTTILTGDVITIHSPDKKVNRVISVGNLATYQETTTDGHVVYAEAEEMVYNRIENKIELFRRGKVTQQDNVFRSEHIIYLIEEELIDAGTPKDRVNITILPESEIFDKKEEVESEVTEEQQAEIKKQKETIENDSE